MDKLFHGEGPYHIETSLFICKANQWTGFYEIESSVMKELIRANSEADVITTWTS